MELKTRARGEIVERTTLKMWHLGENIAGANPAGRIPQGKEEGV